jgi:hypothetical protein
MNQESASGGLILAPIIKIPTLPATTTVNQTNVSGVEIGFSGIKLSFDKAVKITLSGQTGKKVSYTRDNVNFISITNICSSNSQTYADTLIADSECKYDTGTDMIIWTKHFTTFVSYS